MKILMLGNSYTYFSDMPKILQGLLDTNGVDARVDSITAGGRELTQNLEENDALHAQIVKACAENAYDVLVLQEQSSKAMDYYREFLRGVSGCISLVSPKRTVLYATWGRKEGSDLLDHYGWTSEGMTAGLAASYDAAARKCGATCAHVGKSFAAIRAEGIDAELYDPDLSHPSYAGSCVAAMALYKIIVGNVPANLSSLTLDAEIAAALCVVVSRVA